jgi:hypothetical protein
MQSFDGIKLRMSIKGWSLEYVTVKNAGSHLKVRVKVPSLICYSFPEILKDQEAVVMKNEEYALSMEQDGQGELQG